MANFIGRIVEWINAGYPEGVPGPDRVPLFALLKRRLTDDEVKTVAKALIEQGEIADADIGVLITADHRRAAHSRRDRTGAGTPGRVRLAAR